MKKNITMYVSGRLTKVGEIEYEVVKGVEIHKSISFEAFAESPAEELIRAYSEFYGFATPEVDVQ